MDYTYDITLSMVPSGEIPVVTVKQGDASTRFIKATVIKEDSIYHPGAEQTILFREEKPDGTCVLVDNNSIDTNLERYLVTVDENGAVVIELTSQMLSCSGYCKCDLCFANGGETISTSPFVLDVEAAPAVSEHAVSSDYFQTLVSALSHVWDSGVTSVPGAVATGALTIGPEWQKEDELVYTYPIHKNILSEFANFPTTAGAGFFTIVWDSAKKNAHVTGRGGWRTMVDLWAPEYGLTPGGANVLLPPEIELGSEYSIRYQTSDTNVKLYVEYNGVEQDVSKRTFVFSDGDSLMISISFEADADINADICVGMYKTVPGYAPTSTTVVNVINDADVMRQMIEDDVQSIYIVNNSGALTAYAIGGKPSVALTVPVVYIETSTSSYHDVQNGHILAYDGQLGTWTNKDIGDYGLLNNTQARDLIESYGYMTKEQVERAVSLYIQNLDANAIQY